MSYRFIAPQKFLYYFEFMNRDPEYVGVTTSEDGDVALTLFYEDGQTHYIYLEESDLCSLIACLMLAVGHDPCQSLH